MPSVRYAEHITESVADLTALEHDLRGTPVAARVRLLRLLKEGRVSSLVAAAPLLGYSLRQLQRWWKTYQTAGCAALARIPPRRGRPSQLTDAAWAGLEAAMSRGEIATLSDAQRYLQDSWAIEYQSLNGVWVQLHRRGARRKTGRRRRRQAEQAKQDAYKR
jgi:transposase